MLSAAVVSRDTTSSDYLRACLQQTGLIHSVCEWSVATEQHPKGGDAPPDIVLLDISRETEPFFAFASHLHRLHPGVRIIACSPLQEPGPRLLLQAMRCGVQEFLAKPIDPKGLQEILNRFLQESRSEDTRGVEKLIVVMGSKGGVGTSTVAVNLGVQLAQVTQKRVVLLDFARPVGHACLLLDLKPNFTILDGVTNLDRLDGHFFQKLLTHHKSGLEVLAGTAYPEEWQRIHVPALVRLVNVAQSTFDFVVMDYGSTYSSEWNPILSLCRTILLVAEVNVPALWSLQRNLSAISHLGLGPERVQIVINRWHRADEEILKRVQKDIKRPIFARLTNDFRRVSKATDLGVPLTGNHSNPLVSEFLQLATQLAGTSPQARGKRSGLSALFSTESAR